MSSSSRHTLSIILAGLWMAALVIVPLAAQAPAPAAPTPTQAPAAAPQRQRLPDMQVIADSLGVTCEYCHGGRQAGARAPVSATGKPRIEVAKEMIAMTNEANARVLAASGKEPAEAVRVDCATCHRGVAIPRPMRDLMLLTATRQGPDAAVTLYRELRTQYYGGAAYDFSEQMLVTVVERLAQSRPDAAIALADLNIEFFPKSWRSHMAKGIAQTRRVATTPDALESFKKALELDPDNGVVQGWIAQTEPLARRARPQN